MVIGDSVGSLGWVIGVSLGIGLVALLGLRLLVAQRGSSTVDVAASVLAALGYVDQLDGTGFEMYLEVFFSLRGFQVERTGKPGDFGCDLLLWRRVVLGRATEGWVVQAKRSSGSVGGQAVAQVHAAATHHGRPGAFRARRRVRRLLVTNSSFTRGAIQLAASCEVELWDRRRLAGELTDVLVSKRGRARGLAAALLSPPRPGAPSVAVPLPPALPMGRRQLLSRRRRATGLFPHRWLRRRGRPTLPWPRLRWRPPLRPCAALSQLAATGWSPTFSPSPPT